MLLGSAQGSQTDGLLPPLESTVLKHRADSLEQAGHSHKALAVYLHMREAGDSSESTLLNTARIALKCEQYLLADSAWQLILKKHPTYLSVWEQRLRSAFVHNSCEHICNVVNEFLAAAQVHELLLTLERDSRFRRASSTEVVFGLYITNEGAVFQLLQDEASSHGIAVVNTVHPELQLGELCTWLSGK